MKYDEYVFEMMYIHPRTVIKSHSQQTLIVVKVKHWNSSQ